VEGLSHRGSRTAEDHDARNRRVHPPLPDARAAESFHRIRHYGLFANGNRAENIARARELLAMPAPHKEPETTARLEPDQLCVLPRPCPCCGGRMIVIDTFAPGCQPKHRPAPQPPMIRIDTS
jgi:hypothetical protein